MKYCYCPSCKNLQTRNWYSRRKCEICGKDCVIIEVRHTVWGYVMYLLSVLAAVIIVLYAAEYSFSVPGASFFSGLGQEAAIVLMLILIIGAFICAFVDLGKTQEEAMKRVKGAKP